jgi:large subunit ribosomal protein L3
MAAILGKKVGMTQVFTDDGSRVPVTGIEAPPCRVTALRDPDRDGYAAVQLAADEVPERKLTKAELGHLSKAGAPAMRTLKEFRDPEGENSVGGELTVEQFEPGQRVKVSATAIGKGFQGTIRRHNFSRGPMTHGSRNIRAPGAIGASADPSRVFKGTRMPGRMGGKRVTQRGLEIVEVDVERNLLLVRGAVPGPRGGTVEVRDDG